MPQAKLVRAADSSLVVIDIQERLLAAMPNREQVVKATSILLRAARLLNVPVVITEQYPKGLGPTASAISQELTTGCLRIEKTCFSAAAAVALERQQVVLVGMEAHVCVLQTALELAASGREVFVVADAVCSRSESNHQNALDRMRGAGAIVTNVESVLFEWLRDAGHEHFREISRLIR